MRCDKSRDTVAQNNGQEHGRERTKCEQTDRLKTSLGTDQAMSISNDRHENSQKAAVATETLQS